ncbi:NUDIX hydrolase [Robertkochia solimangrovi]|uniref:NUDIX hydrolase n=1 Tax=Robertkochia solimangrovi TaxID=2213046 RepID=UPI001180161E|nr:NUDIX domain-containing protein [Robertkochia solimangrovi]TRZ44285.1 DNA mismatch repair protein MutT [Robertkochia solimangrovi]
MKSGYTDQYNTRNKMYVATDCIVFGFDEDGLKLLLFKRKVKPDEGKWSLIGSFVELEEDVDDAARRVLKEITGLEDVFFEQSYTYGKAERDPGYRCISIAQFALIRINDHDRELVKNYGASWHNIESVPQLVLDHDRMVRDAFQKLRDRARRRPIGFELLPEKFTIPQLQQLYEAIYQRKLDSRNFRKKVISLKVLEKLEEKDKTSSKRGAYLYKFDHDNYLKLQESGINFEI